MGKLGFAGRAMAALALVAWLAGCGVADPPPTARVADPPPTARVAGVSAQAATSAVRVDLTAAMDNGSVTYSVRLENPSSQAIADVQVAVPVPPDVIALRVSGTPAGSSFIAFQNGSAVWHLNRLAAGDTAGPFSHRATATGATPGFLSASARWTAPRPGTATSDPVRPTMVGLPAGVVPLSGVVPGMGEHWANPKDWPLGPIYGVYAGRIIFLEYMIPQSDFAQGANHLKLPGNRGLPPIDHVDVEFEPTGHEGYRLPHYDIHMYMIPHAQHEAIKP